MEYFITFEWLFENFNFSKYILITAIFFGLIGTGFILDPFSLLGFELERYMGALILILSFNLIPGFILMRIAEKKEMSADSTPITYKMMRE